MYLIWSHEHDLWWGPDERGYTSEVAEAGRYSAERAAAITLDHVPSGEEVAVPEEIAETHGQRAVWGHHE